MELRFIECTHTGDLAMYLTDLRDSGAEIISSTIMCTEGYSDGYGVVNITVRNKKDFLAKFKKTDSYAYSDLYYKKENSYLRKKL